MRVMHVNAETGFSGGEVQLMLLMCGLRDQGIENLLCAAPQSEIARRAAGEGFEVHPVSLHNDMDLFGLFTLRRLMKQQRVDLAHLHTGRAIWLGALAARLAGIPAIATKRMDRRIKTNLKSRLIWGHLLQAAVGISRQVVEQMRTGGVPEARCHLIYSTVDPSSVVPAKTREEIRTEMHLAHDVPLLVSLGSLNSRKGFDILIEAVIRLKARNLNPFVWIAGKGPERANLEAQAQRGGVEKQIRFLGQASQTANLLHAADIVVMPSRAEGLGIAGLEAMAAGRPLVASRVGGLAETVVDGRTGILVPPEDPEALAEALERLLGAPDLCLEMGEAGTQRVQDSFQPQKMVEAYRALYQQVLNGAQ